MKREQESRASDETKFEELREDQDAERAEAAQRLADVPEPTDE